MNLYLYSYLHYKIKSNCNTSIIPKAYLRELISRVITRKGGLPSYMIKYVIQDMEQLGLLKFICDRTGYTILENPHEKEVKRLLLID